MKHQLSIPEAPEIPYDAQHAEQLLVCAQSYLQHSDQLIYSYGSRTFLSGYDLFDPEHENRGNIDCSTFVILVLAGIPYEESPYAKGHTRGIQPAVWADREMMDFTDLPDHYVGIAERIGRPELKGPKGLDLKKAEEQGISLEMLAAEIRKSGVVRRSSFLAEYYHKKNACFSDASYVKPGDLVFFLSKGFFLEGDRAYPADADINHVGIIAKDPSQMINSSGSVRKERTDAVTLVSVFGTRTPAFFARPVFSEV